ncbi:MAG: thiosulfate oxidation carrier protein SoxY [Limnobacter sp.]|jgi:sulfur-oxidizing protein SoxY|uniref:Thiosulfate oxidation carrier protein SoxY n=1 Tax=Limnobacter profundi TaxID=2732163 RepID=A0ABX6N5W8_9BURK|nr:MULTISPECIES: thiosulfate oxidation carrier protein SoxY [unclassified Limnobacter]MAG80205.1 thiosulfate oxidation carrier protein SoxY [Sutterellaceae bacterium]MBA4315241.1 thiosulfate oxidation carrier protein SoxY [Alcaligenaceae bacterium]PZO18796.1 MAG: thiosulfate oxidation carrier protein SoxY [Betaproteobacteria bacterium]MBT84547.1 thiosulfate oxidation carrier protein SoxY [Sutterellaceae bacterium]MDP3272749.1 thiosulfate oxidation carrier protein SoxY [Limnobacter sp.]|tara:strand:+ start:3135 stop:3608 length:474 start_codon:yes stop_codon:yes gene_type:complete
MNQNRRTVLKASSGLTVLGLAVAAGLIKPNEVFAAAGYPEKAFGAKSLDELMKALGAGMPTESKDITVIAPDIAENGAVVPVGADSKLKNTTEVALLVANNPSMLSAQFMIPAGTDAKVNTRVKMGKSSDVYALVKADGKYYFAKKEVKVTLGGCGG